MNQRVGLFVLLAAGLLCLTLAPVCRAHDDDDDDLANHDHGDMDMDMDVEDEDLGLDLDEDLEGDVEDDAPPAPKTPPVPKVRNYHRKQGYSSHLKRRKETTNTTEEEEAERLKQIFTDSCFR